MRPLVIINTVGLTVRHLPSAPRLVALGEARPIQVALPALTCSAQATMLTGKLPSAHGIVGNGWLYRDTMEVRFWQQSNRLIQAETVYLTARQRARARQQPFRCAKLFWWFNQGAPVDLSVTPKPHYGANGSKAFDIQSTPEGLADSLKKQLGPFPFPTFWGPMAGLPCTEWIARCTAEVLTTQRPELTLVYLPHLDYDTQRLGPAACDLPSLVGELDRACAPLLDAADKLGASVWVVNEYSHVQVDQPVLLNRALRQAGLLKTRPGPFGEQLDTFGSRAFAVCDHQIAHVYVNDPEDVQHVRDTLRSLPGVDKVFPGDERAQIGLDHQRAGDLVVLAKPSAWFAYPFWLDDAQAPDYARTVDIHRKPGYDPCELFFDPRLWFPRGRALRRLLQKKLGFRMLMDVVPLEPRLVAGSHGLVVAQPEDCPVFVGHLVPANGKCIRHTDLRDLILAALDLAE